MDHHVKYLLFLADFNKTWIFLTYFFKNPQISNLMKMQSLGVELFHVDRQTGGQMIMTKITVTFLNFAITPKKRHKSNWLHYITLQWNGNLKGAAVMKMVAVKYCLIKVIDIVNNNL